MSSFKASSPLPKHRPPAGFRARVAYLGIALLAPLAVLAQPPEIALKLRDQGYALLENEKDAEAAEAFRKLIEAYPSDPLGYANLAIAQLRQQDNAGALASINQALSKAPDRADLLFIRAEIIAWIPNPEAALDLYARAAEAAPNNPEVQYALYNHSSSMTTERAVELGRVAMRRLSTLRPENLVVLLRYGRTAIETGDRAAATAAYLRVRELTWQLDARMKSLVDRTLTPTLEALEGGEVAAARVPALRVENVFKGTPAWTSSMAEIYKGIQGVPIRRFVDEQPANLPAPGTLRLAARELHDKPGTVLAEVFVQGRPLHVLQASSRAAWLTPLDAGATPQKLALPEGFTEPRLLSIDLDNDGLLDVLAWSAGVKGVWQWRGTAEGLGAPVPVPGLESSAPLSVEALDFDSEGDLDLAVLTTAGDLELYRNALEGALEPAGAALPITKFDDSRCVVSADVDADGDTDLLVAAESGLHWLDNNRQGSFSDRSKPGGLDSLGSTHCVAVADANNDGEPDLLVDTANGSRLLLQSDGVFREATSQPPFTGPGQWADLDNDGRLDIVGPSSAVQQTISGWRPVAIEGDATATALVPADRDGDGDLDLVAVGSEGLGWLENQGGNSYRMISLRLQGLTEGNSKNNIFGRGTSIETQIGSSYQYREARRPVTHIGIGPNRRADVVRTVWANGVPQNRFEAETPQLIVEEQVLKGSCPFLYTWNGESVEFVTDLLWGAPLGMPVAPGAWAPSNPRELVAVTGAVPRSGERGSYYDLRITEELWEAAYFDTTRLWIVDAPQDVEVLSTLRVFPGEPPEDFPGAASLVGVSDLRPVVRAIDGEGRDVTARVRARDEVYADGYPVGDYQGIADRPWAFTFDLGETPAGPFRLLLDGWIFPADASLNLAAAQRSDLDFTFTRLEVRDGDEWTPLLDPMGFPAGKSKTTVVEVPPLPEGSTQLRIVTSRWLHWDRIAWTETSRDDALSVQAQRLPQSAALSERGYSRLVRKAPNAPHVFDYADVSRESPWQPMSGSYTRLGDVLPLLAEEDDRLVVMAAGDELRLRFAAEGLPAVADGQRRWIFLESLGWDKDADRNTFEATSARPLPFRAMTGYPYSEGETYPAELEAWTREWLTREIPARSPATAPTGGRD
ncbi:MAG: FG-GAP-like repeat-containing protein [Acidobacteriota bacterium]